MTKRWSTLPLLLALVISWRFNHDVKDVLEAQTKLGDPWMEWPGPYKLSPNRDGSFDYMIEIPGEYARSFFFRVRREWGTPLIGPEKPAWNQKTNPL